MLDAFIHAGLSMRYNQNSLVPKLRNLFEHTKPIVERAYAATEAPTAPARAVSSQHTPQMLPSPASMVSANSANSTPTNHSTGTPGSGDRPSNSTTATAVASASRDWTPDVVRGPPGRTPIYTLQGDPHPIAATTNVPVNAKFIHTATNTMIHIAQITENMDRAQQLLSLRVLAQHYPRTFARMVQSSLGRADETEPDFEDEEGELFWPGSPVTGDGIGWVCLMGKAMIMEFGKEYEYKGEKGAIPKPSSTSGPRR